MYILGLNHGEINSSAALLKNSKIIAASGEERFSRNKKTKVFPQNAINFCLETAEIDLTRCECIAQGWNPAEYWKFFNYSSISDFTKMFLCFGMLVGRLELFPILILLSPQLWKR